jgi:NADH-quinone oxidoreductase subunit C
MTPAELVAHLKEATGAIERDQVTPQGQAAVVVAPARWQEVGRHLKDCPRCHFDFFTFLCGVDLEADGFEVVAHLYSVRRQHHVNMKAALPRDDPRIPTLSGIWRGASWHERETWELFGVVFDGHPHLVKLLLPEAFEGFPMRKDFLNYTRESKDWPGEKEPEEQKPAAIKAGEGEG